MKSMKFMKRFLAALTVGLLLSLVAITVVGGVAFGAIVGSRWQAESMTRSSADINLRDETTDDGSHIRFNANADATDMASQVVNPPLSTQVNQIQIRSRQNGGGVDDLAVYVNNTPVGVIQPNDGSTWTTQSVNLTTPLNAGSSPTISIGPNQPNNNFVALDWFELHNTGSTGGDTTPPAAPTITGEPAEGGTDSDGNVSFSFTGAESGGTFECSNVLQGQAATYSACPSPKPYSGLANGSYTFSVRQKDAAGNVGAAASRNYSVSTPTGGDTTPPLAPNITTGPAAGSTDTDGNVSFTWNGAETGGTFECSNVISGQVDNFSACTSPIPYDGLPNGSYIFKVRQIDAAGNVGAAASRNYSVSTPTGGDTTAPTTSARLVGAGDIATSGSMDTATANLILERPDARVFTAGDNAYPDGAASDFTNKYHPAWGPFKNRTSPSPGNHEYHTSGASGYKNYFGSVAGLSSVNPTYYAYTLGAWRVYALDSNISMAIGSPQYNFVQNDLASNGALCELAYWHHPIASSGQHGNIAVARPIFALFDAQGGDLVLNGHDHNYERFKKINSLGQISDSGVRQIIVGTGGTSLRGEGFVQPGSEVRNSADDFNTHGIVDINLSSTGYSGTFVPVPGKTFTDSFSGTCGGTT
jgi:hypothetical protein